MSPEAAQTNGSSTAVRRDVDQVLPARAVEHNCVGAAGQHSILDGSARQLEAPGLTRYYRWTEPNPSPSSRVEQVEL